MTSTSPPLEAQRFRRSQTPESPRPVHIPEPENIPVLQNQMDPVFNDTSTYNISQPLSPSLQDTSERNSLNHAQSLNNRETVEDFLAAAAANAQSNSLAKPMLMNANANMGAISLHNTFANPDAAHAPSLPHATGSLNPDDQSHILLNPATDPNHETSYSTSTAQLQAALDVHPQQLNPSNSTVSLAGPSQPVNTIISAIESSTNTTKEEAVDYDSLLNQLAQSSSTAPTADSITVATTAAAGEERATVEKALPAIPGLPPKPPPQIHDSNFPQYSNESSRFYALPPQSVHTSMSQNQAPSQIQRTNPSSGDARGDGAPNSGATNGFFTTSNQVQSPHNDAPHNKDFPPMFSPTTPAPGQPPRMNSDGERPWGADVQLVYDQFLADERNYVTEGVWDRFPVGSRLFVGNLPTEKVTKRDLFHVFHKHGKLAQISIKQAYGFVQFLEAASCSNALDLEQGVEIRGRKIHLEISKPQRNTRNAGAGGNKPPITRKRSRSPDRGVARGGVDRAIHPGHGGRPPFSDFRDEPGRKRDDYRPRRSPSPQRHRGRDEYANRDHSPRLSGSRYDRPRSPPYYNKSASPPRASDDEASLSIPRRDPRDVPDVQIVVLEEVPQALVNYLEEGFRQKRLKAATIWLNPRINLGSIVKRQVIEGVQAVVKLTRSTQFSGKIPLQVFERVPGSSEVKFNEYVELDVNVAADIVIHARQKERPSNHTPIQTPTMPFAPNQHFNGQPNYNFSQPPAPVPQQYPQQPSQQYHQAPQHQPQYPPQAGSAYRPPSQIPMTPAVGAPNLQELLANLRQPSVQQPVQQSPGPQQSNHPTDLAGLLSNVAARQQTQTQAYSQNFQAGQSTLPQYGNQAPMQLYPPPQQPVIQNYGGTSQQQNVQNVMDQLARFTR